MAKVEVIAANLKKNLSSSVKRLIKRVCAYCRVSTDSEEQQTSYNSQIEHYSTQIKANPDWEFAGIYADEGITGTQVKNRTEFQRMIDDALAGKIDIIIAKSISRFARNTLDTLKYVRLLKEHNVDVYFEKENIHTLDLDSEMFLTLYSAFAQAESESTSQNVKLGLKAKMKRGEAVGFYGCYGLHWDKKEKKYVIDEEQASVVRRIFKLYIEGIGTGRIAKILTNEKVKTATGRTYWKQATICRIINNEKYVGDLLLQKSYVENPLTHKKVTNYGEKEKYYVKDHHIAIIDRETWEKAQEIYNKRSLTVRPDGHTHCDKYSLRYAFSSKIYCAFCGSNYVRRSCKKKNGEGKHIYWACSHRVSSGAVCPSRSIRDDYLQELFVEVYNKTLSEYEGNNERLLKEIKDVTNKCNFDNDLNKLYDEENNIRKKLSNLLEMKLELDKDNIIDKEIYESKENELKLRLDEIHNKKTEIHKLQEKNKSLSDRFNKIEQTLMEHKKLKEFDRDIFDSIVDCIIVGDTDANGNENPYVITFILNTGKEVREVLDSNYKSITQGNELLTEKDKILNHDNEDNHSLSNEKERLSLDNDRRSRVCRRKE